MSCGVPVYREVHQGHVFHVSVEYTDSNVEENKGTYLR